MLSLSTRPWSFTVKRRRVTQCENQVMLSLPPRSGITCSASSSNFWLFPIAVPFQEICLPAPDGIRRIREAKPACAVTSLQVSVVWHYFDAGLFGVSPLAQSLFT